MTATSYLPKELKNVVLSSMDKSDIGVVNDYNCRHLGGVAGNAGVFSNVKDLSLFIKNLLNGGGDLFSESTLNLAAQNHTHGMSESRGLGFVYNDEKYFRTGNFFPEGSIGHGGWTGQSVFTDLKSGLYAIILTDATLSTEKKFGVPQSDIVFEMIKNLHNCLKNDIKF